MQVGQTLRNRYKILQVIGGGGFASTYLAEDLDLPITPKPKCTIKRLHPETNNAEVIRLFQQEAEILYKLGQQHDRLPKVFAYFEENDEFYLVQEFIDGYDLRREIILGDRWSEQKTRSLILEILEILEFVHSQNIIHRDLKPSNLMRWNRDRKLVLIDFGAVKQFSQGQLNAFGKTNLTVAIGTPGYMPNEQAIGKPRLSSDIYAVGIIAVQALTGQDPSKLPEDENGEIVWRDRTTVSDRFAEAIDKMLRSNFSQRYPSAKEALVAMRSLTDSALPTIAIEGNLNAQSVPFQSLVNNPEPTLAAATPQRQGLSGLQWAAIVVSSLLVAGLISFSLIKLYPPKSEPVVIEPEKLPDRSKDKNIPPQTPEQKPSPIPTVTVTATPTPNPSTPTSTPTQSSEPSFSKERVSFAEGGTNAIVRGDISSNQKRQYVLNCGKGQQLTATVFQGQANVEVFAPDGAAIARGSNRVSLRLPSSGDYTIEVSSGDRTNFNLRIEVL